MNHFTATSNHPFVIKRLRNQYIITFSTIVLLIVAGYFFIHWILSQQTNNARLISLVAQQQMFSEKLSQIALLIQSAGNMEKQEYVDKFRHVLNLWEQSYNRLQFNHADIELSTQNNTTVTYLFADLQAYYQTTNTTAKNLLAVVGQNVADLNNFVDISELVKQMSAQQKLFVQQMNFMASQYETKTSEHIYQIKWASVIVVVILLIVLLLYCLYIFRQTVRYIQQTQQDSIKAQQKIQEKEVLLQANEEALQESKKELYALLNAIPESVAFMDSNGIILNANEIFIQRFHTTLDKLVGTLIQDWLPTEVAKNHKQQLDKVARTVQPIRFEYLCEGKYFDNFLCPVTNLGKTFTKVALVAIDVSEYKQTQQKLHKHNEQLEKQIVQQARQLEVATQEITAEEELHRVILNNISDAVFITDDKGQFTYICPSIENFCGFSVAEVWEFGNILKLLLANGILPDELNQLEEVQNVECEMRNKLGHPLSLLVHLKRVSIKEGTILYTCRDITARKVVEQNFQQVLESAPDAMIIFNQQGIILFVNAQTEKLFGYTRATLLGKHVEILIPERYRDKHHHHWIHYFKAPHPRPMGNELELYALRQDNSEFSVEINLSPIETPEGFLVSSTIRDITERKETEETLHNIVEGISATTGTNFLHKLLEYLTNTLQVKYALIGELHPEAPKMLNVLCMVADNKLVDKKEYNLRNTPCENVITGKIPCCSYSQDVQQNFTNPLLVKMGVESCVGIPLFDVHGNVIGLIAILDNKPLTHQKQIEYMLQIFATRVQAELERIQSLKILQQERILLAKRVEERTAELLQANAGLARAARLKDEFLANMSHELRTPLNAILGMAEVLQEGTYGSINEQQTKSLRAIEESGRHLLSLINDILDLAKIEAGKVKLELNQVSVETIANTCLRLVKELALKKSIKVSTTFDMAVKIIQADERYLKQILLNLLSNAIKFTPKKGVIHLEIRGDSKQGVIDFIVSDTGIGIAEKDIEFLFRPFVQLDGGLNRAHEGTGLGLSLVYRLAEMHGGSVAVESEVGKGSKFVVSLPWQPVIDDSQSDVLMRKETQPKLAINKLHTSALILLVDDNPNIIETLSDYLTTKGYQLIVAWNGAQAIEIAKETHPDIILMDIQMPNMDGIEATRRIRAMKEIAAIPIIAVTALAMPGDKERCVEAGVNDYLSKPISFKRLIAAIEKLL